MPVFDICVAHKRATKLLSYFSSEPLSNGEVVEVPFGQLNCMGVVMNPSLRPNKSLKQVGNKLWPVALPEQLVRTLSWFMDYYPSHAGYLASMVIPNKLKLPSEVDLHKSSSRKPKVPPKLTAQQQEFVTNISKSTSQSFLLHGITGSGKTRVYTEVIGQAVELGRSVIVLSPEIGLISQLSNVLIEAFPNLPIRTMHSSLSDTKRQETWSAISLEKNPQIIIGPRSALFAPVQNIGAVIIDEAHDSSYKQQSQPYYQTTRVAAVLARNHKAKLILGTATPTVSDYYFFQSKKLPIFHLGTLAIESSLKNHSLIVDIKDRSHFTRSGWLSDQLIDALNYQLEQKQQSLIFLNRRGTARVVMCSACGWQAVCPRCDIPLVFHADQHTLLCHTCGHKQRPLVFCPTCKSTDLIMRSVGTKFLTEELKRLFPNARIQRFDSDVKKSDQIEAHFGAIQSGKVDILVGTQILTKGWDLPKLGLVGIVVADTHLFFPDYSAEETTFQHVTQAIGRVGRGHVDGVAIIQTYQPSNATIQSAVRGDYQSFYASQIKERKQYNYPPFTFVMKIWAKRAKQSTIENNAKRLANDIIQSNENVEVLGPTPAFQERNRGMYTWQIVIKSRQRTSLVEIAKSLPAGWSFDIDPINLL